MNPGLYYDLDEATYHTDPDSLSVSGAKVILNDTPAHYHHQREHGREDKPYFDFGHAAHTLVLGVGAPIVVVKQTAKDGVTLIDAPDYRSKWAQGHRDQIRADGKTPVLAHEYDTIKAMAARLREHPIASALLHPDRGTPEVSGFWEDTDHGVLRRFRLDWLPHPTNGRLLLVDYKTSTTANPRKLPKLFADRAYQMQDDWYREGALRTGLVDDPAQVAFLFIVQEKTPPYPVTVHQLDGDAQEVGRQQNTRALAIYADCVRTGSWPAYPIGVESLSLPPWYVSQQLEQQRMEF